MSELDRPSINEDSKMPKDKKIKIAICVGLCIVLIGLIGVALFTVRTATPPEVVETVPIDEDIDYDEMHVAKSSWRDGAWCAVEKDSVTGIHVVKEYNGECITAWSIDEMMFYQIEDGNVYIAVGPGVHMVGSMHKAFAGFTNATVIEGLELLETSRVTDMSFLFSESKFEKIDISTWDTTSVSNFSHMLYQTQYTYEVNMNNLDLSNVVDASFMFAYCTSVSELYLENVNTSHILNMESMFEGVGSSAYQGATVLHGDIDTSSCVNMKNMFKIARLANIPLIAATFNTSNVTNMEGTFYHCLNTYELDLSGWDVSKVTNMTDMFNDSNCLVKLNMEGWNPTSLEYADRMFRQCNNLRFFNQWGPAPNIKSADAMFENCFELRDVDITCFDGATLEKAEKMFYCVQYVENIYSNGFTVKNYANDMFTWCIALKGPTPYDETKVSSDMATTTGYLTATR